MAPEESTASSAETPSAEKVFAVRKAILADEARLLRDWPILKNQDAIGFTIFAASVTSVVAFVWAFAAGRCPLFVTVFGVAFAASLLHELEHDIIHQLYFRKSPWVQVRRKWGALRCLRVKAASQLLCRT